MKELGKSDLSRTTKEDWLESFIDVLFQVPETFGRCCSVFLRAAREGQLEAAMRHAWYDELRAARRRCSRAFSSLEDKLIDLLGAPKVPVAHCLCLAIRAVRETMPSMQRAVRRIQVTCALLRKQAGAEDLRVDVSCSLQEFLTSIDAVLSCVKELPLESDLGTRASVALLSAELDKSRLILA